MTTATKRRLASVDEANLVLDHSGQVNAFLVAGVLAEGGFVGRSGVPDVDALRKVVGERIATVPQLRQIAVRAGRRHRWVDASPNLDHHVRLVGAVAGLTGLESLCAELMTVPLPRDRPMWEILLVPGARVGGIGVVLRIHHAIADGMAAVAIVTQLFDVDDRSAPAARVRPPARSHSERGLRNAFLRFGFRLRRIGMTLGGREVGSTVLLGRRSPHRGVAFLDADLASLEAHARPCGATVNDTVLAAVASGFRAALRAAGEEVPALLPVSVPVALPRRGSARNQVGIMLVRLPLREPDPNERLRLIALQTRSEKADARRHGTLEFMRGPVGARIMDCIGRRQHLIAGVVTNVPGTSRSLRLAGSAVKAIWPVSTLAANVRLTVAAASYDGRLRCSAHFDADHIPGAEFARAMQEELARMAGDAATLQGTPAEPEPPSHAG